jgi:hypothetical protein
MDRTNNPSSVLRDGLGFCRRHQVNAVPPAPHTKRKKLTAQDEPRFSIRCQRRTVPRQDQLEHAENTFLSQTFDDVADQSWADPQTTKRRNGMCAKDIGFISEQAAMDLSPIRSEGSPGRPCARHDLRTLNRQHADATLGKFAIRFRCFDLGLAGHESIEAAVVQQLKVDGQPCRRRLGCCHQIQLHEQQPPYPERRRRLIRKNSKPLRAKGAKRFRQEGIPHKSRVPYRGPADSCPLCL